jgi:hypothetical protein
MRLILEEENSDIAEIYEDGEVRECRGRKLREGKELADTSRLLK